MVCHGESLGTLAWRGLRLCTRDCPVALGTQFQTPNSSSWAMKAAEEGGHAASDGDCGAVGGGNEVAEGLAPAGQVAAAEADGSAASRRLESLGADAAGGASGPPALAAAEKVLAAPLPPCGFGRGTMRALAVAGGSACVAVGAGGPGTVKLGNAPSHPPTTQGKTVQMAKAAAAGSACSVPIQPRCS
jgi:hypothetical protein